MTFNTCKIIDMRSVKGYCGCYDATAITMLEVRRPFHKIIHFFK